MAPPPSSFARKLWKENTRLPFDTLLGMYEECVCTVADKKNKKALISNDNWLWKELPKLLKTRESNDKGAFVTKDELVKIMDWKLTRGKMRPIMRLVQNNSDSEVKKISKSALNYLKSKEAGKEKQLENAVSELTKLSGIGPATASVVLAAYCPDMAAFMADEAWVGIKEMGDKIDYKLKDYLKLSKMLQEKAESLKANENKNLTVHDLSQALWCASTLEVHGLPYPDYALPEDALEDEDNTEAHPKKRRLK